MTPLYRCENVGPAEGRRFWYTNSPIAGAFRGYGVVQTIRSRDRINPAGRGGGTSSAVSGSGRTEAEERGARRRHRALAMRLIGHGLEDCIRRGMQEVAGRAAPACARRRRALRRGWGMGCEMHGSSAHPGIKEQGNAIVKMNEDGTVVLLTGTAGLAAHRAGADRRRGAGPAL